MRRDVERGEMGAGFVGVDPDADVFVGIRVVLSNTTNTALPWKEAPRASGMKKGRIKALGSVRLGDLSRVLTWENRVQLEVGIHAKEGEEGRDGAGRGIQLGLLGLAASMGDVPRT